MQSEFENLVHNLISSEDASHQATTLDQITTVLGLDCWHVLSRNRLGSTPDEFQPFQSSVLKASIYSPEHVARQFSIAAAAPEHRAETLYYWRKEKDDNLVKVPTLFPKSPDEGFDQVSVFMRPIKGIDYALVMTNDVRKIEPVLSSDILLLGLAYRISIVAKEETHGEKLPSLGNREYQVLAWTSQGKTSYEISKILNLSENTVNNYVLNATKKLGASNRTHAVSKAIHLGLI